MNSISHNRAVLAGNPWGAVAPRVEVGTKEFKVPDPVTAQDSVELGPFPSLPPSPATSGLAQTGQTTGLALATPAGSGPLMLLLLGGHDSSKKDQAKTIAENLGLVHLQMGQLINQEIGSGSPLGKELDSALQSGEKSPARLLYDLVAQRVEQPDVQEKGFILDAYPEDLRHHQAESLLQELEGLKLIQLAPESGNCPSCIPFIEEARRKGAYYQVDDEEDRQDTADVLEALVDNIQSSPLRWIPVQE